MKKTNKKLLLTSALVSVCGCFALVACGGDDKSTPAPKPTALDTPTGVSVSVNMLSWSEVTGATNGYTVKINNDETTTVDTTSLDLTTVVTLLSEGDNSLQVKANAAGGKTASAYSAAVTYEYHATVTPTPFEKPVITLNGDTVTWAAVSGATNGYTVKVNTQTTDVTTTEINLLTNTAVNNLLIANSDNSISVKVKAAGDKLESEYSNTVTYEYVVSSDKAAQDFIAAVNAIGTVAADKADAIGLAKTKYNAIKNNEEALAVDGVTAAIATLKQKDAQYFAVLVSGIQAVTEDDEVSAFTTFETKYAAALEYYGGLLDNTVAAAQGAKGGLDALKGNYDNLVAEIQDTVDALADEIDALVTTTLTQEYYEGLTALKTRIDALGDYAKGLFDSAYVEKLNSEMTRVETTVTDTLKSQSFTRVGTTAKVSVFRTYVNCLGNNIELGNAPTLAVTGNTVTVLQTFTKNNKNEYVAIINIENVGAMGEGSYTVSLGSDAEEPVVLQFGEVLGYNPYFSNDDADGGFKKAVNADGDFIFTIQDDCTATDYYLDVYYADAVVRLKDDDDNYTEFADFSQQAIGTIDITDWTSPVKMEDLNRYLANKYESIFVGKGEVSVRFAIYGTKEDDGVVSYTRYDATVISGTFKFNLTENDKYYTLPTTGMDMGIWNNDNNDYSLIGDLAGLCSEINATLTENKVTDVALTTGNAKDYLGIKFEAVAEDGTEFTKNLVLENKAYNYVAMVNDWSLDYYKANMQAANGKVLTNVKMYISYYVLDDAPESLKTYFPQAQKAELHDGNETVMTKVSTVTLDKSAIQLPNTGMRLNGGKTDFEFLRDTVGNGKLLIDGEAEYLEIKLYLPKTVGEETVETSTVYAYLYKVGNKAIIYKNKEDVGKNDVEASEGVPAVKIAKLDVNDIDNAWISVGNVRTFFETYYSTPDGYALRWDDGYVMTSRYVLSENSKYLIDGDWSEEIEFDKKSVAFTTNPQVTLGNNKAFGFIEAFTPQGESEVGRGKAFTLGGIDKVELHFYQGTTEATNYYIYITYNVETQKVEFYYDKNGVKTAFTTQFDGGDDPANAWCQQSWMEDAIKEYLAAVYGSVEFTGEWKMYTVTHLRDGSAMFIGGDENGNVKSTEYDYTVLPPETDGE